MRENREDTGLNLMIYMIIRAENKIRDPKILKIYEDTMNLLLINALTLFLILNNNSFDLA